MIADPSGLFVECDRCHERVDFSFSDFLNMTMRAESNWLRDELIGWEIDWGGPQGDARCYLCKSRA